MLAELHHAVSVADGAGFFGPGGGGQHHVGQPGGFGHEDVLHHHVLQTGHGMAGMVQVRVAHGRVFAHDVHAANLVRVAVIGQRFVHDLDHGVARLVVQLGAPEVFKPGVCFGVAHALVVGVHHRDQARIAGALHVVLAAQRMQTGTGLANLAGDGGQRDQATHVVSTVDVLAHAHAPQNHGTFGGGIGPRDFAQGFCGHAANGGHGLGAVALDVGTQGFEVACALAHKGFIHQALFDDGVDHGVEHGHIGVGLELHDAPGVFAQIGHARIGQHYFGAAFGGVLDPGGGHRVVGGGVGANDDDDFGMLHIVDLVAHSTRAHTFEQGGDAGGVAQAGAVVHVVGAKAGAHQFLEQVGFLVAAFGRAKTRQRFGTVGVA